MRVVRDLARVPGGRYDHGESSNTGAHSLHLTYSRSNGLAIMHLRIHDTAAADTRRARALGHGSCYQAIASKYTTESRDSLVQSKILQVAQSSALITRGYPPIVQQNSRFGVGKR
jgi:hypothetical protein